MPLSALPLAALPFPAIDPIALQLGPIAVHWYGLGYVVGILFAWWYTSGLSPIRICGQAADRPSPLLISMILSCGRRWASLGAGA